MIIYLSGPMSGLPDLNYPEFHRVAKELTERGFEVLSPADIVLPKELLELIGDDKDWLWNAYMREAIPMLMRCNTIALLKGWQESAGAGLEITIAAPLGMKVVDAYTLEPIGLDIQVKIDERKVQE